MVYYITTVHGRGQPISAPVGGLRFDAGSLSLNLVATVARRYKDPIERLDSPERLCAWLSGVGLSVDGTPSDDDLARVRAFREDLNELFRSALAGTPPAAGVLEQVNAVAAAVVSQLCSTSVGVALASSSAHGELDPVLALIAADAIRIVTSNDRLELRTCQADDCQMVYLARGRRERRWCSSERCGNRSRVAAHRARTARTDRQ
jgi:predicted RNA-binding Zn ribbon-like protein